MTTRPFSGALSGVAGSLPQTGLPGSAGCGAGRGVWRREPQVLRPGQIPAFWKPDAARGRERRPEVPGRASGSEAGAPSPLPPHRYSTAGPPSPAPEETAKHMTGDEVHAARSLLSAHT